MPSHHNEALVNVLCLDTVTLIKAVAQIIRAIYVSAISTVFGSNVCAFYSTFIQNTVLCQEPIASDIALPQWIQSSTHG